MGAIERIKTLSKIFYLYEYGKKDKDLLEDVTLTFITSSKSILVMIPEKNFTSINGKIV